jgi:mannose-6-phosphate isomerase-like protein (cupin superfamily)
MLARDTQATAYRALPSKGMTVALAGERYTFVAVSGETREAYTICEVVTDPHSGPPSHVHHREDEAWMILEGTYEVRIGERVRTLGAGAFIVAPKNVPHSYRNIGATPGMLLATIWPAARFERLLVELGTVVADGAPLPPVETLADAHDFALAAPKHGIEVVDRTYQQNHEWGSPRLSVEEGMHGALREAELVGAGSR